ncbi:TonB-dependent receptor [Stenotrophomonas geniculata]|jgi:iron complex outermembrane recepter protein|uniref:TonB-dependent receptor n=1 Tax=Stenotrophomonas geniculata TaxID=86188 RepID=UPI00066DB63A|nr:TonB-dependent siderophore receptor [Stenotrophomonas geniculata]MBH1488049.1 TonB-dependent siderophore receptor [Stenotrophomonas maltophilia]MBN5140057.1 TonB-dependent siderophore receptor [Stenotrophomonas maltophilia]MDH7551373.1 TonB-dependent siderophore receptor [Stenotrophomonas geniculata]
MTVYNFSSLQHRAAAASSGLMHPPGIARRYRMSALALGLLASFAALADSAPSTLPSVQVQEQRRVTADYAGGQVAAGSRVGLLGDKDFMDTPFNTVSYTESFIRDRQAKDLTDVIAATDPTVFSNGVTGSWSENYAIRGFASNTSDTTFNGLSGMAPYYRTSPEMFERIEVLKGPSALLNGMPPGGSVGGSVNLVPKRAGDQPLLRVSANFASDAQFGAHVDAGRRLAADKQFGIRFNGAYRDGDGAVGKQSKKVQLGALALDWRGERARLSADLYSADDRVDGPARGVGLAPGVAIPRPPRGDTLINPDWAYVDSQDKGAMLRGELDINDTLMAYLAYGTSRTDYRYNGSISAQILNPAGDFTTVIGQLAFDIKKQSADAGLRGSFHTGSIGHQLAANVTHYQHTQNDYGRRSVPGWDWTTNLYNPVWGPAAPFVAPHISHTELKLDSLGFADTLAFADDRVQLTLGVRRQQVVSETFNVASGARTSRYDESATTPAAALLVKATERVSIYTNYIEGLSQGATAPMTAANAGDVFAPFRTRQKELGLKLDLGSFAHTFSVYEIKRPNSYIDPVTNIFSFGGEQRNRGVEWGFFGTPLDGVRLLGGVAYVQPKLTRTAGGVNEGCIATAVAQRQAKLGVEWDVPTLQGLTLTGNATAMSKQYISADNNLSVPGRTLFDVGARYSTTVAGRPLALRASVNNVTNKAYWGMPLLSSLALGAPRTVLVSATMDF